MAFGINKETLSQKIHELVGLLDEGHAAFLINQNVRKI